MLKKLFQKELRIFKPETSRKRCIQKKGILYTLYSDKSNLLRIGFANDLQTLQEIILKENLILLDKKRGDLIELNLIRDTLHQLGISIINNKYLKYSNKSIRHLCTLGWPTGKSIIKQRLIKKKFILAVS